MKYMIMMYGTQQDYDQMAGRPTDDPAWSQADVADMHRFMEKWNNDLVESGEFVDARGLVAPVHTRRIHGLRDGVPLVTDGPFAETQEVLVGYTIVECESFDRATEIAARATQAPNPGATEGLYIDVRPIADGIDDLDG